MKTNRGFSLVELLTSTAVLAVLGAIVGQVAQANDKQSQANCLKNIKMLAEGIELYKSDSDDLCPLATTFDHAAGKWRFPNPWNGSQLIEFPYNWRNSQNTDRWNENLAGWANSIYPYVQNRGLYTCPSGYERKRSNSPADKGGLISDYLDPNPSALPALVSYTYNGLLHACDSAIIKNPAELCLLWEGTGNAAVRGFAMANPMIRCSTLDKPCKYIPYSGKGACPLTDSSEKSATLFDMKRKSELPGGSFYVHTSDGKRYGMNIAYCDTHAKFKPLGQTFGSDSSAGTDRRVEPFVGYDAEGFPTAEWSDGCWPYWFRPDNDFKN